MKRVNRSSILGFWGVSVLLLLTNAALAFEKEYTFQLVNWDEQTLNLDEPDMWVRLRVSSPEAQDEKALDAMYQKSVLPELEKERAQLKEKLIAIDNQLSDENLSDDQVRALWNQANDDYHQSVDRVTIIARSWHGYDHHSFIGALAGSTSTAGSSVGKEWTKTTSHTETTRTTTQEGSTTHTETHRTTKSTSTSFGVSVDPVGAVMQLSGLFGKKRQQSLEPRYFPGVRSAIDGANQLGGVAQKDSQAYTKLVRAIRDYDASSEKSKQKSLKNIHSLLDGLTGRNRDIRQRAGQLQAVVQKALADGARNDSHIADTLAKLNIGAASMDGIAQSVDRALADLSVRVDEGAGFQEQSAALMNAVGARDQLVSNLQKLAYQVSRDMEY